MSEQVELLRERNKRLLERLERQKGELERLRICNQGRKMSRDGVDTEARHPEVLVPRRDLRRPGGGAQTSARRAEYLRTTSNPPLASKHEEFSAGNTTVQSRLQEGQNLLGRHSKPQETGPFSLKSPPVCHSRAQEVQVPVTFNSNGHEEELASEPGRRLLHPLLGYDWIAGILDGEDWFIEGSDEFFNDLCLFRSLNEEKCFHPGKLEFVEDRSGIPQLSTEEEDQAKTDAHKCSFHYRINSRLFPVPLQSQECCQVCKKHKSAHPHTAAEPAQIRISVPRSLLLSPYKYKPHRRCSFDPGDSLGLSSHCLSGWSNSAQNLRPPLSSLPLRKPNSSHKRATKQLEDPYRSRKGKKSEKTSEIFRLPRFNFQHFSPKRKLGH